MNKPIEPSLADGRLFDRICQEGKEITREDLQRAAQLAIQVEFSTIPVYLTGMYSIIDPDTRAYQALRSVAMEEMFHINQAANTLVAIGGLPKFTGDAVPKYPCHLPQANPRTTPFLGLLRASLEVFENVYAAIEKPAAPLAAPQADNYDTIAQLYEALVAGMKRYVAEHGKEALFKPDPAGRQRTDIYIGKFGGEPVVVTDLASAEKGIEQIVEQGEGSLSLGEEMRSNEPWAIYNQYGRRSDGTYGPIIGAPHEPTHFIRFREVALDAANFPATYPIVSNPRRADFANPRAQLLAEAFDLAYSLMLDALEESFRQSRRNAKGDAFFGAVLPLMHQVMPVLARMLMTTPIHPEGDSKVGPNAAPTYLYQSGVTLEKLKEGIEELIESGELSRQERLMLVHAQEHIASMLRLNAQQS